MIVFTNSATPNATVQRFRLRSTSEPPPNGPAPAPPMPNAPESPASFPECSSTRKTRTTEMNTCRTDRNEYTAADCSCRLPVLARSLLFLVLSLRGAVDLLQDRDRLAAQSPIERPVVVG